MPRVPAASRHSISKSASGSSSWPRPFAIWATKAASFERLRINHYASRSEEEAREKIARQRPGWGHLRQWRERDLRGELDLVRDERSLAGLRRCGHRSSGGKALR
jgi:hypothetical protein